MQAAIQEAERSAAASQYPIGAVVVSDDGHIIAVEHTSIICSLDPTAHAEINAIRSACQTLKSPYLPGCWLYSTLEPCPMCTSAAIWSKMQGVVYGTSMHNAQTIIASATDKAFTWRYIDIPSRYIIAQSKPEITLVKDFLRTECELLIHLHP